jgi:UDP-N-acetyl-D-glucosamine dehydrogenase
MQTKVGIIGQGYVGLPLALAAAKAGYSVQGYDNNVEKIDLINQAVSPIRDIANAQVGTEQLARSKN